MSSIRAPKPTRGEESMKVSPVIVGEKNCGRSYPRQNVAMVTVVKFKILFSRSHFLERVQECSIRNSPASLSAEGKMVKTEMV